jgi:hypothetical protein
MNRPPRLGILAFVASLLCLTSPGAAQCATDVVASLPPPYPPTCLTLLRDGRLAAGIGGFDATTPRVAIWNGAAWTPLPAGIDGYLWLIVELPGGDLVVFGNFTVPAPRCLRWNGSAWLAMGSGLPGTVEDANLDANGDLWALVTGVGIRRWNGSTWVAEPSPGGLTPQRMARDDTGVLYVTTFPQSVGPGIQLPGRVFQQQGSTWVDRGQLASSFGSAGFASAICALPGGGIAVAGNFTAVAGLPAQGYARWDGTSWSTAGGGPPWQTNVLRALPNGDVLAAGNYAGLLRSDGSSWTPFAASLATICYDIEVAANGDLYVLGGTSPADGVTRLASTCAATSTAIGTPCVPASGALQFSPVVLPWQGAVSRSRCTGMTATAIGLGVFGLQPTQVPLALIHPSGLPGCDLLAAPDALALLVPTAGAVEMTLPIPTAAALVGVAFWQQVLQVELGLQQITAIAGSNALRLQIGRY